ncbi:MAG TPA: FAD-linked oxidase C-terminal domain-containing protein, partial [Actinomycetota bacterium]|nr:FAD-linked oxidase C-terminal domain-containing protein [Actinomycetota bacterium]
MATYVKQGKPAVELGPKERALEADLRAAVEGEVRFDAGTRAVYSTDASNYRQVPIGVVVPRTVEDVIAAVGACHAHGVPILSRGGGTSLAGQCCNVAVVIDHSKYLRETLAFDREGRTARVQGGTILDDVRQRGLSDHPLVTFGPDPSTHDHCTIGGMIGNNSCGNHAIMAEFYGPGPRMEHNVLEMDVLTSDGVRLTVGPTSDEELERIIAGGGRRGEIYGRLRDLRDRYGALIRERFPDIPRRVSGYGLDALLPENGFDVCRALVGTESTCVTVLEATLQLIPAFERKALALLGFEDIYAATEGIPLYREHRPIALEGWDAELIDDNRRLRRHLREIDELPRGEGWIMAEFGGDTAEEADDRANALLKAAGKLQGFVEGKVIDDPQQEEAIWAIRESGLGATAFVPGKPDALPGWEDSSVPPDQVAPYLRDLHALFGKYGYTGSLYGHFGQGCIHVSTTFDLVTEPGIRAFRSFIDEASDLVLSYGGSLSGEHGDGQSRGELLEKMYGRELVEAFREFKAIWDPDGMMNPGKVIDAKPILSDLKLGADYRPPAVQTHFGYPDDGGSFAHAAFRCQGIGKCRAMEGHTMCPSYQVTREEMHSTRGRARILFEMLNGSALDKVDLWRSKEVEEALDLCLSCKGCKSDCPVNVDMATYKAEFLSHRYERRLRPRQAYALGLIYWWARAASKLPWVANFVSHAPALSSALKWAGGVTQKREAPRFAEQTFVAWFRARTPREPAGRSSVLLWPDTFVNYLHPDVGKAHVEVLEAMGYEVVLPDRPLCCGRPLYDYGMLDTAKRLWRQVLDELRPHIEAGTPLIGMEPSCLAAFRDELPELFPNDPDATRLADRSMMLSEFLAREEPEWPLPTQPGRRALVHPHCHHKAVMAFDAEERALHLLGLDVEIPDQGCCGLAGSFGFEAGEKYELSRQRAEQKLWPA